MGHGPSDGIKNLSPESRLFLLPFLFLFLFSRARRTDNSCCGGRAFFYSCPASHDNHDEKETVFCTMSWPIIWTLSLPNRGSARHRTKRVEKRLIDAGDANGRAGRQATPWHWVRSLAPRLAENTQNATIKTWQPLWSSFNSPRRP